MTPSFYPNDRIVRCIRKRRRDSLNRRTARVVRMRDASADPACPAKTTLQAACDETTRCGTGYSERSCFPPSATSTNSLA